MSDPRTYLAAERTFLAWLRTGIALMAFGLVVARFGVFLRGIAGLGPVPTQHGSGVCLVSAFRHRSYVKALDEGRFRSAFGSTVAFGLAGLLVLVGVGMALFVAML